MTNVGQVVLSYVNIAEAKARLSGLVEKAARGEEIVIARDPQAHSEAGADRKARGSPARLVLRRGRSGWLPISTKRPQISSTYT